MHRKQDFFVIRISALQKLFLLMPMIFGQLIKPAALRSDLQVFLEWKPLHGFLLMENGSLSPVHTRVMLMYI
jgi:hypothetical protein